MKTIGWLVVLAAAVFGLLWLRRRGYLAGVFGAGWPDPLAGYLGAVGSPYPPGGLPPIPPTPGTSLNNWGDAVAPVVSATTQIGIQKYCESEGGKPAECRVAGRLAGWAMDKSTRFVADHPKEGTEAVSNVVGGISGPGTFVVNTVRKWFG